MSSRIFTLLLLGTASAALTSLAALPAQACGGIFCHRCARHAHGASYMAASNAPLSAPVSYATVSYMPVSYAPLSLVPAAQFQTQPQNLGLSDIGTLVELIKTIRGAVGGGESPPTPQHGDDWAALSARVNGLQSSVSKNTADIVDLTNSQQEIANVINTRLDELGKRIDELKVPPSPIDRKAALDAEIQVLGQRKESLEKQVQNQETLVNLAKNAKFPALEEEEAELVQLKEDLELLKKAIAEKESERKAL